MAAAPSLTGLTSSRFTGDTITSDSITSLTVISSATCVEGWSRPLRLFFTETRAISSLVMP